MRKVLSFVLVLSLVLGSFSMAFAAAPKDVVGLPSEEAVTVLSDLGVVSGYDDGTYKPENIVTRAEMAVLIIRALGLQDYVSATAKSKFPDMAGYGWAEGYIAYAESLGMLSGYPDGTFKPGRTVSYDEAASMLVRSLGYTAETLPGSWPANFIVKAKALGILDGIQAGAAGANRGDVAIMLYQTIDQPIGSINKEGEWVSNNKTDDETKDDTMLSRLGAEAQPARVLTNADEDNATINIKKYLGAFAVTYEKNDKIIAVGEVKSTFLTGEADSTKFTGDDVDYTQFVLDSTVSDAAFFINGADESYGDFVAEYDADDEITIAVKLSGKRIVEIYSYAIWESDSTVQFTSANAKEIEDDLTLEGYDFVQNDDDEIDTNSFVLVGAASLDDIEVDNVVVIYADGNDITKIEVGTEVVKGQVTKIAGSKYTIDGKAYELGYATDVNLSEEGTAYLDYYGKIAFWDVTDAAAGNYAVVLIEAQSDAAVFDSADKAKLLLADGTKPVLTFKDDATTTQKAITEGAIVKYATNKAGELTKFDGVTETMASGKTLSAKGVVGGKLVAENVVVFVKDDTDYSVGKLADIKVDKTLGAFIYALDSKGKIAAIVIDKVDTEFTETYGMVLSTAKTINTDGDKVQSVTVLIDGVEKTYLTEDEDGVIALGTGATAAANKAKLYKFTLDGDVLTACDEQTLVTSSPTGDQVLAYDAGFTTVAGVDAARINVSLDPDDPDFQVVDGAAAYMATFKSDGTFDKYAKGSLNNIAKDYHVVLVQVDDDSDNWDLVIYVRKADAVKGYFPF